MNGADCIFESINIFENALTQRMRNVTAQTSCSAQTDFPESRPLIKTAAALADKSGYSPWHFSRLFAAVTGLPPKAYIAGRIMSECAKVVAEPEKSVSLQALALAADFDSYETFSRCFKRMFGIAPRTLQKSGSINAVTSKLTFRIDRAAIPTQQMRGLDSLLKAGLRAEIAQIAPLHCTGLAFYTDTELANFGHFWETFSQKERRILQKTEPNRFLQYTAWTPLEENGVDSPACTNCAGEMMVLCAVQTDAAAEQNPVFVNRRIPGGTFLHVQHTSGIETIGQTYQAIYGNYVAQQELPLPYNWEYQLYEQDGSTSIFIPLSGIS